jgi:tetratricopeptide (TPR) repeat protein
VSALAAYRQLADLLLSTKRYPQALAAYRHLYEVQGARDRTTLLHYGFSLEQTGALEDSVRLYREALAVDPHFLEAHVDLAGVLWRLGDFDGSLTHAQAAVAVGPDHPYAVRILGTALLNLNRLPEAEAALRHALELKPGFVLAELDLAFVLLLAGRLEEGWAWYRCRWNDVDRLKRPPFFQPALEWKGRVEQPLAGQRIAVYAEQGLGDVIQFIRYVPLLQAEGAAVFGVVPPELVPLLEHSFPGFECLTPDRRFEVDSHVALLELPMHFGTALDNIRAAVPYLRAPVEAVDRWRGRMAPWAGKFRIGIAWSGFQGQVNNRNRAVSLGEWMPLLQLPGVQCFSLQKGDPGPWTDVTPDPQQLVDLTGEWRDFNDSAAMLQHLDLVITVDTAIAHLAGALGRPCWVMLPPNPDWRWLLDREDSPWYPGVRLFRRGFREGRSAQLQRVTEGLVQLLTPPQN